MQAFGNPLFIHPTQPTPYMLENLKSGMRFVVTNGSYLGVSAPVKGTYVQGNNNCTMTPTITDNGPIDFIVDGGSALNFTAPVDANFFQGNNCTVNATSLQELGNVNKATGVSLIDINAPVGGTFKQGNTYKVQELFYGPANIDDKIMILY